MKFASSLRGPERPAAGQSQERQMKRNTNSRQLKMNTFASLAAILLCLVVVSATQVFAQTRMGRPPSRRELEGTAILPAGAQAIQEGTVLIVEMDTRIDSGNARVSDRFSARIATPVVDANGRTLLQAGTRIEGHVTNVKKAKWRHRSGEVGLSFDFIALGDGRNIPIRGSLVSATRRVDEEGNLRAGSTTRRDILITTGSAATGAGIGAAVGGGALAGGGIGAAAGLTFALLMKGKDVVIDPGDRFNLQLAQTLSLSPSGYGSSVSRGAAAQGQIRTPVPLQPRSRAGTSTSGPGATLIPGQPSRGTTGGVSPYDPNTVRTTGGRVPVYDVRAERGADGYVRTLITSETPTAGWRIYTHHELRGDTLEVRLWGIPPSGYGIRQLSRTNAPMIIAQDQNGAIRRILVHGSNGDRYLTLNLGSGVAQAQPYQPPQTYQPAPQTYQPARPPASAGPSDGSSFNPGFTGGTASTGGATRPTGTSLSALATQTANQIDTLRLNYAAVIGLWVNRDGTVDLLGGRRPTANERQLFDTLSFMLGSARALSSASLSAYERQRNGQQLQADAQTAQQMWLRVRSTGILSQDLERQWQNVQNNLRLLIDAASR
jgi:hypothetical protein